jgi:hypothetical protein
MADIAFTAKFKIIDNPTPLEKRHERSPEENIVVDFTSEQAMAAASYLMTMAEQAEAKGQKIRVYTGKDEYTEHTGFSLWGGKWGNKGSFTPLKPESPESSF